MFSSQARAPSPRPMPPPSCRAGSKVLLAESDELANNLVEPLADLIVSMAASYDTIISAATSVGKNVLPRVAALLDVAQVSEIIEVVSADTFKRPIYAGKTPSRRCSRPTPRRSSLSVRASFAAAAEGGSASVEARSPSSGSGSVDLRQGCAVDSLTVRSWTSAKIIISGGPRTGFLEKFQEVILPVADKLGAARGASRAAVDAWLRAERLGRSARPARSWRRSSTSPAVIPALSSTGRYERI